MDGSKRRPGDSLDDLPICVVRHARQVLLDDGIGARQIPVEVAMNRGVVETAERSIEAADGPAKALEQRRRAGANFSEGSGLEIGDEPHEMNTARPTPMRSPDRVGSACGHNATRPATCAIAAFWASSIARSSVAFAILST
jgi:hypothetical protein